MRSGPPLGSKGRLVPRFAGRYPIPVLTVTLSAALAFDVFGSLRAGLFYAATDELKPDALLEGGTPSVTMSVGAAVAVLLAWTIAPLALGAWRTCTRDA
jgi:hypothetical protein